MSTDVGRSSENWLVIPPTPPHQWWLDPAHHGLNDPAGDQELRELQKIFDENEHGGRPFTSAEHYRYARLRGMRDLFYLGKFVLGFDRLQGDLHADLAYAWQCPDGTLLARGPAGLFRWATIPRGHLKCVRRSWWEKVKDRVETSFDQDTWKATADRFVVEDKGVIARCFRVRTKSGREVEVTGNHPFLTWRGWRSIDDGLKVGDWIATARRTCFGARHDPVLAEITGWMIGDANIKRQAVTIKDDHKRARFMDLLAEAGLGFSEGCTPGRVPYVNVNGMRDQWRAWGLYDARSADKFVPAWVLQGDQGTVVAFLRGLFTADATTRSGRQPGRAVTYTTRSARLASDVQHLLIKCGLHTYRTSFLIPYGGSFRRVWNVAYTDTLGIFTAQAAYLRGPSPNDRFPPEWRRAVARGRGLALRQAGIRIDNAYASTRDKVRRVADWMSDDALMAVCDSDLSWEPIVEVTDLGPRAIVSIESKTHTLGIGDIVTHNTTLLTISYAIFLLLRDHNERILIYSANFTIAKKIFGAIRTLLEGKGAGGAFFLDCYPELATTQKAREKWNENMLTIPREQPFSDHSLECSGVGATITGSHFTTELVDDAVGKIENAEQTNKILDTLNNLDPLLDSFETGKRRMACTPWGSWDPAARAERTEPEALVCRRSMFEEPDPLAACGRRPITDPAQFTYARLTYRWKANMDRTIARAKKIARETPYFMWCQFHCWPKSIGTVGFKAEWFRRFVRRGDQLAELDTDGREKYKIPIQATNIFILVDPIGGDKRGTHGPLDPNRAPTMDSDYVGIAVVAISDINMRYVLEIHRERYNDDEFLRVIFELVARYHPRSVHIEGTGGQRHIFKGFLDAWKRGKPMFVLGEWAGGRASKSERIRGLIPPVSEGFMLFRAEAPEAIQEGIDGVIQTLLDGDSARHDDDADALSAVMQVGYAPSQNQETDRQRQLTTLAEDDELARLDPASRWAWECVRKKRQSGGSMFGLGDGFNSGGANA